jgi:hypothetical protein
VLVAMISLYRRERRSLLAAGALALIVVSIGIYVALREGYPAAMALQGGEACAAAGGSVAVRAYAVALTNPTELGMLVRGNATFFAQNGDAVECYRVLAAALASNTNLSQLDALRDRAEAERETGLEFDRDAYTDDLAETLRELADALPALAKGDDGPYRSTKAYESASAYSTLLKRAPGASARVDTLIQADEEVLRALAGRVSGR